MTSWKWLPSHQTTTHAQQKASRASQVEESTILKQLKYYSKFSQLGNIINAIGVSCPQDAFLPQLRNAKTLNKNTLILNKELFGSKLHYMDFQNLERGSNFLADRLFYLGSTVSYLLENRNTLKNEIERLEQKLETRVTKSQLKSKLKRRKVKWLNKVKYYFIIRTQFKDCEDIIIDHVEQIRAKMSRYQEQIVNKVDVIQSDLHKRVFGLEKDLSQRCTQQFVRDLVKQIEERLLRDYIKRSREIEDSMQTMNQEFKKGLRQIQTKYSSRIRDAKDKIQAIEEWYTSLRLFQFRKFKYLFRDKFQDHIKDGEHEHGQIRALIKEQERIFQHLEDRVQQLATKVNNFKIPAPVVIEKSIPVVQQIYKKSAPSPKPQPKKSLPQDKPKINLPQEKPQRKSSSPPPPKLPVYQSTASEPVKTSTVESVPILKSEPTPVYIKMPPPPPLQKEVIKIVQQKVDLSKYDNLSDVLKAHLKNYDNLVVQVEDLSNELHNLKLKHFHLQQNLQSKAEREDIVDIPFLRQDIQILKKELDNLTCNTRNSLRTMDNRIKKINIDPHLQKIYSLINKKAPFQRTMDALVKDDKRISNLDIALKALFGEMEGINRMIKACQAQIGTLNLAQSDILAGTRSMNCLVCGRNQLGNVILNSKEHRVKSPSTQQKTLSNFPGQAMTTILNEDMYSETAFSNQSLSPGSKSAIRKASGGIMGSSNLRSQTTAGKKRIMLRNNSIGHSLQPLGLGRIQKTERNGSNQRKTNEDYDDFTANHKIESARGSVANSIAQGLPVNTEVGRQILQAAANELQERNTSDLNYSPRKSLESQFTMSPQTNVQ